MSSLFGIQEPEPLAAAIAEVKELIREGKSFVPPRRFVAEFVKLQRSMLGWKQSTLASFANISVSTVERIERADTVSTESLNRVAVALEQKPGAFTAPRTAITGAELERRVQADFAQFRDRMWISARPLRTQPQVAQLARTHIKGVDRTRLGNDFITDAEVLAETLDCVGYAVMMEEDRGARAQSEPLKRRQLYALVLSQVKAEQKAHAIALAGSYSARTNWPDLPEVDSGVIVFFPLPSDPGAIKRRNLLVPTTVDLDDAWRRFCGETNPDDGI